MRVFDLQPGMQFKFPFSGGEGKVSTFITWKDQHPIWPSLALVIWRLPGGEYSFDALSLVQELPWMPIEQSKEERTQNLFTAMGIGG